jgi:hypothetical protein
MNVIIVTKNGVMQTPLLIEHSTAAEATFESLAIELLGEDADEICFMDDDAINQVNELLQVDNIKIDWFMGIEVNKYKN